MSPLLEPTSRTRVRKIEANRYLPALARGLVSGGFTLADAAKYFEHFAALYSIGIDTNAICNLKCNYCYLDRYNRSTTPEYIDLSQLFDVLTQHCEESADLDLIALVGKEPFADARGVTLLRHLDALSQGGGAFRFGVVTNGVLVDRYLDDIPSSISYVDVSLDGPASVTNKVRGAGVFEAATRNIKRLVQAGFDVWISAVLHIQSTRPNDLKHFMRHVSETLGCVNFYFSPIRNFTGSLQEQLLSFEQIAAAQDEIIETAEILPAVRRVILDHPYEAVWRDYFWKDDNPHAHHGSLCIDSFGNILHPITHRAYRKLDIFPHGPWGTCRIDAAGNYLWDVESRTFHAPDVIGSVTSTSVSELHRDGVRSRLGTMLQRFWANMSRSRIDSSHTSALTTVSLPMLKYLR